MWELAPQTYRSQASLLTWLLVIREPPTLLINAASGGKVGLPRPTTHLSYLTGWPQVLSTLSSHFPFSVIYSKVYVTNTKVGQVVFPSPHRALFTAEPATLTGYLPLILYPVLNPLCVCMLRCSTERMLLHHIWHSLHLRPQNRTRYDRMGEKNYTVSYIYFDFYFSA